MASVELKYLVSDWDRNGNIRHYVRLPNRPKVRLRQPEGTDAFLEEYRDAIAGKIKPAVRCRKITEGSVAWLCRAYYLSTDFRSELAPETQKVRRRILNNICDVIGEKPFGRIESHNIRSWMDARADRPEAANGLRKALSGLFKYAKARGLLYRNPMEGISKVTVQTEGFHTWTVSEVRQFEARHPIGTTPRLALALLLYTGQRRGDVVMIGPQHIQDGVLKLRQRKTGVSLILPILPELRAILRASRLGEMTFLATPKNRPYSPAGFGMRFRKWCDEAGLPKCTAHGLRKAGATIAAEAGASDRQLMAIFGWKDASQATVYTRAAEQQKLARDGMALLVPGTNADQASVPLGKDGTIRGKKSNNNKGRF